MKQDFLFAVLGLGAGAVYAAVGLSVVLTFRGTGVINFASGAIALYPAFAFNTARTTGVLVLPVSQIRLASRGLSVGAALTVGLLMSVLLGLALHYLVFQPIRHAPPLAKVVASIGVLLVLQAFIVLRFGSGNPSVAAIFPQRPVHLGGLAMPVDRFFLSGAVVVTATLLWALYRFTRFGLATRAVSENEKTTILLGYSPQRLALINVVLASLVAGLMGILVGPVVSLNAESYSLLIVPALAAALVGRFTSFGVTAAAALCIGMLESLMTHLTATHPWVPASATQAIPFVVIVVAMVAVGNRLPGRGAIVETLMPTARRARHPVPLGAATLASGAVLVGLLPVTYLGTFVTSMQAMIMCLSLVLLTGYLGQVSVAQMAFAGIAAFSCARWSTALHLPFVVAAVSAVATATLVGLLFALPALRVRGVNLAVVTVALAVATSDLAFADRSFTGQFGQVTMPHLPFLAEGRGYAALTLAVVSAACVGVAALRRSRLGLRMLAVRANEHAAAAAGIDVARTKLVAFGASAALAGLGGLLLAYQDQTIDVTQFDVLVSVGVLAAAYLGGIASVGGAVAGGLFATGGLVFYLLQQALHWGQYQSLILGASLIATIVMNPEGFVGGLATWRDRVSSWNEQRRCPTVTPSEPRPLPALQTSAPEPQ